MNRRTFLATGAAAAVPSPPRRPNFLFIMVDQQHPGCLGFAGHLVVRTPNLDALAKAGTSFRRAYVANPLCMPSRSSIFTGLTPRGHRARMNGVALRPEVPTFTDALRGSGYRTHAVGKLHFATSSTPNGVHVDQVDAKQFPESGALWLSGRIRNLPQPYFGFESADYVNGHGHGSYGHYVQWLEREHPREYRLFHDAVPLEKPSPAYKLYNRESYKWALPGELHPAAWIGDRTIDFLKRARAESRPFFVFCSFQDPHPPFAPSAPWCHQYDSADVPPANRADGELDRLPPHFRAQHQTTLQTQGSKGQPMKATDPYRGECAAHYYGLISMIDRQVGRILETLRAEGLENDTVVVFTADHGEALGDHWMWGKGPYHIDSVIRVPLLCRWPGHFRQGAEHTGVVSLLDLAPTFLDLAGVGIPQGRLPDTPEAPDAPVPWPGRSLRAVLESGQTLPEVPALVEEDEDYLGFRMRTLVTARYRLTTYSGRPYGEFFDLQNDPHELRNLWDDADQRRQRDELRLQLFDRIMETDLPLPRQTGRA